MRAYDEIYLDSSYKVHEYLFHIFRKSEFEFFGLTDRYLHSWERSRIDSGNPLALNLTPKQLMNRTSKFELTKSSNESIDPLKTNWLADLIVYMQWFYSLKSVDIAEKAGSKVLYDLYSPLHEASLSNGASKVFNQFF